MSSTSQQPADTSAPAPETSAVPETGTPAAPTPAEPRLTVADCARELRQLFPALFDGPPKPLKLRIQADIQARTEQRFSKKLLSVVLGRYTGSTAYLIALTRATHRYDLDGQPVDTLTEEHRQIALEELQRRRAITAERRAQERAAARGQAGQAAQAADGSAAPADGSAAPASPPPQADGTVAAPQRTGKPGGRGEQGRESANRHTRGPGRPGEGAGPRDARGPREGGQRPPRPPRAEGSGHSENRGAGGNDTGTRHSAPGNRPPRSEPRAGARPQGDRPRSDRPQQMERAGRPERSGAERQDRPMRSEPSQRHNPRPPAGETALPENPERRQRALLLRDFERTTLTAANFCALKGLTVASLNEQLTLARQEAAESGAQPRRG